MSRKKAVRGLLALTALGLALALLAFGRRPAALTHPNILLVTIDTLRADHVGCYGFREAATPVLDGLAARGVRLATAVAQAPLTAPSHASILTGLNPIRHGVRNNGGYVLPADLPTLAEDLQKAGYRTAAFVSGFPLDQRFGFARGFGAYDDRLPHGDDPRRAPYVERRADQTTEAVLRWLDAPAEASSPHPAAPWFLWVHYYDPHSPYEPPGELQTRFASHPYDGEIAFVDVQLGRLLDRLAVTQEAARTLVLVTADHGESLDEHGEETHGIFLYDATLKVPWIMAGPGVPRGVVAGTVGRGIDVAPTLLDYAAVASSARRDGRSLRPAAEGAVMSDEPAYSESLFAQLHLGWAPLHAWRTAQWKLVDAPRPELYDLRADPGEKSDLAGRERRRTEDLQRQVRAALATKTPAAAAQVSEETSERLNALGYLGAGASPPRPEAAGAFSRDPKDGLSVIRRLERGMAVVRSDPPLAVKELSAVLEEDAGVTLARRYRAVAEAALGQHDKAIADLRVLEKAGPLSAEDLMVMGDSLRLAGRTADALAALDRAERLQPRSPLPWINRAGVLLKDGRTEEAAAAYERALALSPGHVEALRGLGDIAIVRGDSAGAERQFERILAAAPHDAAARVKLGVVRMRQGQGEAAVALFKQAVDEDPMNAEALLYLAGALAAGGRAAEAIPYFERAVAAGPPSTMALNGLGFTRLELGDRAGAISALRQSLALQPNQREVAQALAQAGAQAPR